MRIRFRAKKNSGSSLMFVIMAIAFIGILGTIILQITTINISTKAVDKDIKKNFYTAETVLDQVDIVLQDYSLEALKAAYVKVIDNYDTMSAGSNYLKNEFAVLYVNHLLSKLNGEASVSERVHPGSAHYVDQSSTYTYSKEHIKSLLKNEDHSNKFQRDKNGDYPGEFLVTDSNPGTLILKLNLADYSSERYILLKDIKVNYVDTRTTASVEDDQSTTITTDIKIKIPNLSFETANIYPEYTKYAIIANHQLGIKSGVGTNVKGNIYAGDGGIHVAGVLDSSNPLFSLQVQADRIISRGNITVQQGARVKFGDPSQISTNKDETSNIMDIWAENIETENGGAGSALPAYLNVVANSYVSDDLELNANYSDVTFNGGNYYGYSFNKDNAVGSTQDSDFSSSVLINGKNVSLNMENVDNILLGGRAYVSRYKDENTGTSGDIPLGEAVSLKFNQTAYLIPDAYLKGSATNLMPRSTYDAMSDAEKDSLLRDGLDIDDSFQRKLKNDWLTTKGYTTYVFSVGSDQIVYFYYEFKSLAAANEYFEEYFGRYGDVISKQAVKNNYFSSSGVGLKLSANVSLFATGNVLFADPSKDPDSVLDIKDSGVTAINPDNPNQFYLKESIRKAKEYKSRQLCLTASLVNTYSDHADDDAATGTFGFRLNKGDRKIKADTNVTFSSSDPIFDKLLMPELDGAGNPTGEYRFTTEAKSAASGSKGFTTLGSGIKYKAVPLSLPGYGDCYAQFFVTPSSGDTCDITGTLDTPAKKRGIIVSNGNVSFSSNISFEGLIIANQDVMVSTEGINCTANPELVQSMFTYAKKNEGSWSDALKFTHYFVDFQKDNFDADIPVDQVDVSECISYVNWKKNRKVD